MGRLVIAAALFAAVTPLEGQISTLMRTGDTVMVDACRHSYGTIYDDGGPDNNYTDGFTGTVVVEGRPGSHITLLGDYDIESCCDRIHVFDDTTLLADNLAGVGMADYTTTSGRLVVTFVTDGSGNGRGLQLNWSVEDEGPQTCAGGVDNLMATDVTATGATLSWTGSNGMCYVSVDGWLTDSTAASTITLTGLGASQQHDIKVWTANTGDEPCCAQRITIRTLCEPTTLPYRENYDRLIPGIAPDCWLTSSNFDDPDYQTRVTEWPAVSGRHSLMMSSGGTESEGHYSVAASPAILGGGRWYVSMRLKASHNGLILQLGTCDSVSSEAQQYGFSQRETMMVPDNRWAEYNAVWDLTGDECRVALRMLQSEQWGAGRRVYIDDVKIQRCGVDSLRTSRMGTDELTVQWTTFENPTVDVDVSAPGVPGQYITNATSPLTLTNLLQGHDYTITLFPHCGTERGLTATTQGMTEGSVYDDLCSNFDNGNDGWSWIGGDVSVANGTLNYSKNGETVYLVSPRVNNLAGKWLSFGVRSMVWSGTYDTIFVGLIDNYADDTASFIPFDTVSVEPDDWRELVFGTRIPSGATGHYVAFKIPSLPSNNWVYSTIDNIYTSACGVDRPVMRYVQATRARLTWDANGRTDSVTVVYGIPWNGFPDSNGDTVRACVGDGGVWLTGLSSGTSYEYIIAPECGGCGMRRDFRTRYHDYNIPFCYDFDDRTGTPDDFQMYYWNWVSPQITSNNYHSATNSLELTWFGRTGDSDAQIYLPDAEWGDSVWISFWAAASNGNMELAVKKMYNHAYFDPEMARAIDTVAIGTDWHHYAVRMDNIKDSLLAFKLISNTDGVLSRMWIDDLQIGPWAYGDFNITDVSGDGATLRWSAVPGGADSLEVRVDGVLTAVLGIGDTLRLTGLDSGSTYNCYVRPLGDSTMCWSFGGRFTMPSRGDGNSVCWPMDGLLSYELPAGWTVSGATTSLILNSGDRGEVLRLDWAAGDTLRINAGPVDGYYCRFLTMEARALVSGVSAAYGDTLDLDAGNWNNYTFTVDTAGTFCLYSTGGGSCLIDNVAYSMRRPVNFYSEGGMLVCMADSNESPYEVMAMNLADSSDIHIFSVTGENPYRYTRVRLGETYVVSYSYHYGNDVCLPRYVVTIDSAYEAPICFDFEEDVFHQGLPPNWEAVCNPSDELSWTADRTSLVLCSYSNDTMYLMAPMVEADSVLSVRLNLRRHWGDNIIIEIGTVNRAGDISSFQRVMNFNKTFGDWTEFTFDIPSHGRRVAVRTQSCLSIDYVSYAPVSSLRYSWTSDSVLHVYDRHGYDTLIVIPVNQRYYIDFREIAGDTIHPCGARPELTYQGSRLFQLPYCGGGNYADPAAVHYWHGDSADFMQTDTWSRPSPHMYVIGDMGDAVISEMSMRLEYIPSQQTDMLYIGVVEDVMDYESFVVVDSVMPAATGVSQWKTVSFENYSGPGRFIAFKVNEWFPAFNLMQIESCPALTAKTSVTRYNELTVNGGGGGGLYVEYGPAGFTRGTGTFLYLPSLPATLQAQPLTEYDVYFSCDSSGISCAPLQKAITPAPPIAVGSCTDFDASATMPAGWTTLTGQGSVDASVYHTAPYALHMATDPSEQVTTVVLPDIDRDSLDGLVLSLWVYSPSSSDRLTIGVMSDYGDASTFQPLQRLAASTEGGWKRHFVDLSNAPSGCHFVAFRLNSATTANIYVDDVHLSSCAAWNFHAVGVESDSAIFMWNSVGSPDISLVVESSVSTDTIHPSASPCTITDIQPRQRYSIRFISQCGDTAGYCNTFYVDSTAFAAPGEAIGCVDVVNLSSPSNVFYSGTYGNPYSSVGAVNYGSSHPDSRHTVHRDTAERDPRTGGLLRTVPEGAEASLRLGNWSTNLDNPEAEGVIYSLWIDTMSFDMLLLRYAAVLQDPRHAQSDQPRFRLELLDSNFNQIDPACTASDFIADRSLGWNEAENDVLWKDWTSIGLDLSPYAGQLVYVRLTTYDCNEGSHYGYAYFTLDCMMKSVQSDDCGITDSLTFTAPVGFTYSWRTASGTVVGTSRQMTFAADGTTYYCDLGYVDNPACGFTVSAYSGVRMPLALMDTIVTVRDCRFEVQFQNQSTISSDGINPVGNGENCESAWWSLGNGTVSGHYHASAVYDTAGTYEVTLVAGIAGGRCYDTLTVPVTLSYPATATSIAGPEDLCVGDAPDTLRLVDAVSTDPAWGGGVYPLSTDAPGQSVFDISVTDPNGCPQTLHHSVTVHPSYYFFDTIAICSSQLPMSYGDTVFGAGTTEAVYVQTGVTAAGCDSNFNLILTVADTNSDLFRDTTYAVICDNQQFSFHGALFNTPGTHYRHHLSGIICDSLYMLQLTVNPTAHVNMGADACDSMLWNGAWRTAPADWTGSTHLGCDSVVHLDLSLRYSTDTVIIDTAVQNDLPRHVGGAVVSAPVTDTVISLFNTAGCDSTIHYSLHVWPNVSASTDSTICENSLPFTWNGVTFIMAGSQTTTLLTTQGADSVLTMNLHVNRNTYFTLADTILQNNLLSWQAAHTSWQQIAATVTPSYAQYSMRQIIPNAVGCDSIITLNLHVWRNRDTLITLHYCTDQLPDTISIANTALLISASIFDSLGAYSTSLQTSTAQGADSIISLSVFHHPIYEVYDTIIFCPGDPFVYEGVNYGGPVDFDSPHLSVDGCDSLVHVSLQPRDTNFRPSLLLSADSVHWQSYDSVLLACAPLQLHLLDSTPGSIYREWMVMKVSAAELDTVLVDTSNVASPDDLSVTLDTGVYSLVLIMESDQGCHDTVFASHIIHVLPNPKAEFTWVDSLPANHNPEVSFINLSQPSPDDNAIRYLWNIDGVSGTDTSSASDPAYRWGEESDNTEGTYNVLLSVFWTHTLDSVHSLVCVDTISHPVVITNVYLQFPNLVTPNGDGINDRWEVVNLVEFGNYSMNEVWIYDRWGYEVWHARDIRSGVDFWDPEATNSPDGTYYYRFTARGRYGIVKRNGLIEVLR